MVFEKDSNNPQREKKGVMATPKGKFNSVADILPTKNGIYKPSPAAPAKSVSKPETTKPRKSGPKKVQYSSQKRAVKGMKKTVKRAQKGKAPKTFFNI